MIPNLDVNEAYITYLFVRPYWRKCGIATFIIYHLIQVGAFLYSGIICNQIHLLMTYFIEGGSSNIYQ